VTRPLVRYETRVRVCARGRTLAYDDVVLAPVETYRIEASPASWSEVGPGMTPIQPDLELVRRQHDHTMKLTRRRTD
jgi:hypothetical protein